MAKLWSFSFRMEWYGSGTAAIQHPWFWMVLDGSENLLHRPFFSPQVRGKVSLEKVPGQFPSSNTWGDSVHVTIVEKHQAGSS